VYEKLCFGTETKMYVPEMRQKPTSEQRSHPHECWQLESLHRA
jgi:hypothetical protein